MRLAALAAAVRRRSCSPPPRCASTPAEHARRVVTLARHLDNPRGIAHAPDGSVYIAEAGHSGANCGSLNCFGFTGAVARYRAGRLTRLARGSSPPPTPSRAARTCSGSTPSRSAPAARSTGSSAAPPGSTAPAHRGRRGPAHAHGGLHPRAPRVRAGARAVRERPQPRRQAQESDPYGIVAHRGALYVADAGANDLLRVRGRSVSLVAAFPAVKGSDSVPTCVAVGPDGALYVGEFASYRPGLARVWRVVPGPPAPRLPRRLQRHHRARVRSARRALRHRGIDGLRLRDRRGRRRPGDPERAAHALRHLAPAGSGGGLGRPFRAHLRGQPLGHPARQGRGRARPHRRRSRPARAGSIQRQIGSKRYKTPRAPIARARREQLHVT